MEVKTNSLQAWLLASRPKTLSGAAAPVILGGALAWVAPYSFRWWVFFLALQFALLMQVAANLINDYYDWKKDSDRNEDRLGPERACSQGWITPAAMKRGIAAVTAAACLVGIPLAVVGGWWLIGIGALCVVFAFVYSTSFSYLGLGDLLVLVFFGIVPVGFTFLVLTEGHWTTEVTLVGLAQGVVTDMLLMVNNYRDRHQDRLSNKKTLIVRVGNLFRKSTNADEIEALFGKYCYLVLGISGVVITLAANHSILMILILLLWLRLHYKAFREMEMSEGRELNAVLGRTSVNIFLFAILVSLAIVLE